MLPSFCKQTASCPLSLPGGTCYMLIMLEINFSSVTVSFKVKLLYSRRNFTPSPYPQSHVPSADV